MRTQVRKINQTQLALEQFNSCISVSKVLHIGTLEKCSFTAATERNTQTKKSLLVFFYGQPLEGWKKLTEGKLRNLNRKPFWFEMAKTGKRQSAELAEFRKLEVDFVSPTQLNEKPGKVKLETLFIILNVTKCRTRLFDI